MVKKKDIFKQEPSAAAKKMAKQMDGFDKLSDSDRAANNERALGMIKRARTQFLSKHPFFAALAIGLKLVATRDLPFRTMAVDGRHLFYDPDFVVIMSQDEVEGVIAHEALHVAYMHMLRRGEREPMKWNVACDLVINGILEDNGFTLPEIGCLDRAKEFRGMNAERVYSLIPDPPVTYISIGDVLDERNEDGSPLGVAERKLIENEVRQKVQAAYDQAKKHGNVPGGIEGLIEEIMPPVVDWRAKLRAFISGDHITDYRWDRPNRRMIRHGIYMPSVKREGVGTIVCAIDTSGSVSDQELAQFLGEIDSIIGETCPERVVVIQCDAHIQRVDEYTANDRIERAVAGRGGTRFTPPFDYVEKNGIDPQAFVYLTDMMANDYPETPDYRVMWCCVYRPENEYGTPPFGEVIEMRERD